MFLNAKKKHKDYLYMYLKYRKLHDDACLKKRYLNVIYMKSQMTALTHATFRGTSIPALYTRISPTLISSGYLLR